MNLIWRSFVNTIQNTLIIAVGVGAIIGLALCFAWLLCNQPSVALAVFLGGLFLAAWIIEWRSCKRWMKKSGGR